ncbi:MAG: hypothetical protein ACK52I_26230 [Pseudomonadota bacterium]
MIQEYVDRFMANKSLLEIEFGKKHPDSYGDIVKAVIQVITGDDYDDIDPERIHEIDDGDYQGTLLFVIASKAYQPSDYWSVFVSYGSCSHCDTLQSIRGWDLDEVPTADQVSQYMTLALHIVQGLKKIGE